MDELTGKRAAYFTLGCKLNFAETGEAARCLRAAGVETAVEGQRADICVVNTCSVTEVADSKCRQAIGRMVRQHPGALVVVTGCYAQLQPARVAGIEGVDLVLGAERKGELVDAVRGLLRRRAAGEAGARGECLAGRVADIRTFVPCCASGGRTRYFLKVQDGCDYYCSYCTIPMARGRSRNGSVASLAEQARRAAAEGAREIVVTGVNIGDFGRSTGESLLSLLRALDGVEGVARYRISSLEPDLLTDDVLRFCARSRAFMPHFHIPLQSGSERVLRLMRRRYGPDLFLDRVARVRELLPDAFIGADVIVGMRGETDELFGESLSLMERADVSQYHVFPYSERPGTMALRIPHAVPSEEKRRRVALALGVSERKLRAFYNRYIGQTRPVLLEHSASPGSARGFTDNYVRAEVRLDTRPGGGSAPAVENTVVKVRLTAWGADGKCLAGEVEP